MKKNDKQNSDSVERFLHIVKDKYDKAFRDEDKKSIIEASGTLCIAYAALGQGLLAQKWAEEYLVNLSSKEVYDSLFNPQKK